MVINSQQTLYQSDHVVSILCLYNFIIPLVVAYLNDGDVMARLLTINKSIKQLLPKYSFKRICDAATALKICQLDAGILFSITRIRTKDTDLETLLKVVELNREQLKEVHYDCRYKGDDCEIPECVTHLKIDTLTLMIPPGAIPNSVVDLDSYVRCRLVVGSIPSSVKVARLSISLTYYRPEMIPVTVIDLNLTLNEIRILELYPGIFPNSIKSLLIKDHDRPFPAGRDPLIRQHIALYS